MRFAIRDDDTCYFTRPEELDKVWGPILPDVPVSLAVTPFALRATHLGDLERYYQGPDSGALQENQVLVAWLREQLAAERISVMCHGVTHEYQRVHARRLIPECIWKSPERLAGELRSGRRHLEDAIGHRVRTFVPPGNGITLATLGALRSEFGRVLASVSLRRVEDALRSAEYLRLWARSLLYRTRDRIVCPFGGSVAGVEMRPSYGLNESTEWSELERAMEFCHRLETDFIVAVHYWEVRGRVRDLLYRLLDRAASRGFRFAHCDEVFDSTDEAPEPAGLAAIPPTWRPIA